MNNSFSSRFSCSLPVIRKGKHPEETYCSGFTLLEMLLAITVLAVIAVLVAGAMRAGYHSAEKGERKIEFTERLRRSIEILESQIQSSLPLAVEEQAERKPYFSGDSRNLTLSTNYSAWDGRRGYVLAEYSVRSEGGKESLVLTEKPIGVQHPTGTVLLKDCDYIEFTYQEKGLTKQAAKWLREWKSDEAAPERIKVAIRSGGWDYSYVVRLRVGGAT